MDPAPAHCIARVLEQILAGQSWVLELELDAAFLGSLETAAAPAEPAPAQVRAAPASLLRAGGDRVHCAGGVDGDVAGGSR